MMEQLVFLLQKTTSELDPFTERLVVNGFLVLLMLMGGGFIWWAHWEKKKVEQMEEITAICVKHVRHGVRRHGGRSHKSLISVFEYTYCGTTYTEKDAFNTGTNVGLPVVGEPCIVKIDPAHPEKPYYLNNKANLFMIFMGVVMIVLPLFGIIMYNMQF